MTTFNLPLLQLADTLVKTAGLSISFRDWTISWLWVERRGILFKETRPDHFIVQIVAQIEFKFIQPFNQKFLVSH